MNGHTVYCLMLIYAAILLYLRRKHAAHFRNVQHNRRIELVGLLNNCFSSTNRSSYITDLDYKAQPPACINRVFTAPSRICQLVIILIRSQTRRYHKYAIVKTDVSVLCAISMERQGIDRPRRTFWY